MELRMMIWVAGVCHFGLLIASFLTPRVLEWKRELQPLSALSRHVIWTHGGFIVLTIIGFGVISLAVPGELAGGTALARAVTGFMGVFWLARLCIQLFFFDAKPYLTKWYLKIGYRGLTVVFAYFAAVYGWAAVVGGSLAS